MHLHAASCLRVDRGKSSMARARSQELELGVASRTLPQVKVGQACYAFAFACTLGQLEEEVAAAMSSADASSLMP